MARRSSFTSTINRMAREGARAQRQQGARQRKLQVENQRQHRAYGRELKQKERLRITNEKERLKEQKQQYLESRFEEANKSNTELEQRLEALKTISEHTLEVDDKISFDSLCILDDFPPLLLAAETRTPKASPSQQDFTKHIEKPAGLSAFLPWSKSAYEKQLESALASHSSALAKHGKEEKKRLSALFEQQAQYEQNKQAFVMGKQTRNQAIGDKPSYRRF